MGKKLLTNIVTGIILRHKTSELYIRTKYLYYRKETYIMAEKRNTETLVAMEHQPEAAEAMAFVAELGPEERKRLPCILAGSPLR